LSARFLKHVQASIQRLGFIKPEYAGVISRMMDVYEGEHPRQIARRFRQIGDQLPREDKRAMGIRVNADMTVQAANALTQRGLSEPLKGLENTILDASIALFRERTAQQNPPAHTHCWLEVSPIFSDCSGCNRMKGARVTAEVMASIPPTDCEREACSLGYQWRADYLAAAVESYKQRSGEG
jgi:hypothetical protein